MRDNTKLLKLMEMLTGLLKEKSQELRIKDSVDLAGPSQQPELWNLGL